MTKLYLFNNIKRIVQGTLLLQQRFINYLIRIAACLGPSTIHTPFHERTACHASDQKDSGQVKLDRRYRYLYKLQPDKS